MHIFQTLLRMLIQAVGAGHGQHPVLGILITLELNNHLPS